MTDEILHGEVMVAAAQVVGINSRDLEMMHHQMREARGLITTLAEDLESALNIIRHLSGALEMACVPNPDIVTINNLLRKYKMPTVGVAEGMKVYVNGNDITEHPDSVESDVVETLELVADEEGNVGGRITSGDA
jgi:hypothetical protein